MSTASETQSKEPKLTPEVIAYAGRMFDAARKGDSAQLLPAIDAGLPVDLTNDKGNTFLMLAAYAGHLKLTQELLNRKADMNRLNDMGQSVIGAAVYKGYKDVVQLLAQNGADPRLGDPANAIQLAHMFGRTEMMEILGAREGDIGPDVPSPLSYRPYSKA